MKKKIILISISVMVVLFFSHRTPTISNENNIPAIEQKITDSQAKTDSISGFLLDVSTNETFPFPDPLQKRAIAIILVGSIPVSFIFLIILYRSRRRKKKQKTS
ncbi:MAG: hypothetical protein HeimC3_28560 [Candidatus Heimdallarchaeota archaeon LC_3]|nr:MAG: hypothetical protein HeimC3_28560 [Candidatus Heimdallarchaeota archaeon LC_3]